MLAIFRRQVPSKEPLVSTFDALKTEDLVATVWSWWLRVLSIVASVALLTPTMDASAIVCGHFVRYVVGPVCDFVRPLIQYVHVQGGARRN